MRDKSEPVEWFTTPPAAFDIATCWFPRPPSEDPGPDLRPALITAVLQSPRTGHYACKVCLGTKNLKLMTRNDRDVIVQNARHIDMLGLKLATRFDLDARATLPWNDEFFGYWAGYSFPVIGSFTETYIRDYAFKMMRRNSVQRGA